MDPETCSAIVDEVRRSPRGYEVYFGSKDWVGLIEALGRKEM